MDKDQKNNIRVKVNPDIEKGVSKYRLIDGNGKEIKQVNNYLDSLGVRGLSDKTIRTYAFYLLDFWRWKIKRKIGLKNITRKILLEYVRYQQQTSTAPVTINRRSIVIGCLYQHHFNTYIPHQSYRSVEKIHPSIKYRTGWLRPTRIRKLAINVKVPRKIIVPLTTKEVSQFFQSLKTWRDIAIVGFMLFCGLRKNEVITLKYNEINISENQARIHGKGNRERIIPIPRDLLVALNRYIELERPEKSSDYLFVVLKGPHRGNPLTESGIRSIFRYHRNKSRIFNANPHRFRHTFGTEMVKAGISIAVLMKLMGHAYIQTTMLYVNISAHDVRDEFNKVIEKLNTKEMIDGTIGNTRV
jgi:site-specific recombinase XerD